MAKIANLPRVKSVANESKSTSGFIKATVTLDGEWYSVPRFSKIPDDMAALKADMLFKPETQVWSTYSSIKEDIASLVSSSEWDVLASAHLAKVRIGLAKAEEDRLAEEKRKRSEHTIRIRGTKREPLYPFIGDSDIRFNSTKFVPKVGTRLCEIIAAEGESVAAWRDAEVNRLFAVLSDVQAKLDKLTAMDCDALQTQFASLVSEVKEYVESGKDE